NPASVIPLFLSFLSKSVPASLKGSVLACRARISFFIKLNIMVLYFRFLVKKHLIGIPLSPNWFQPISNNWNILQIFVYQPCTHIIPKLKIQDIKQLLFCLLVLQWEGSLNPPVDITVHPVC